MSCAISPPLKTIRLGGQLGKRFGRVHRLAVGSVGEAVRALVANYPEIENFLREGDEKGVGWRVKIGADDMPSIENIHDPVGPEDIRFIPVIRGHGSKGIFEIIAGVLLIAASFIPGLQVLMPVGIALVLGGVSNLLSPQPKTAVNNNEASYMFAGPANTLSAGMPVPILYGELIVGGAVISAGQTVDQVPTVETGVPGLSAIVQETTSGGVSTFQLFASWSPAGLAIGYDVTIQGAGFGPVTLARTTATSLYYSVPGAGPYEVICNPVEPALVYRPGATCWSSFIGG